MANKNVSQDEFKSILNRFKIRLFLPDLPRLLNGAFEIIYNMICMFYDPDTQLLKARKADIDYITATTVVAQNISFKGSNGEPLDYQDLVDKINDLQRQIDELKK